MGKGKEGKNRRWEWEGNREGIKGDGRGRKELMCSSKIPLNMLCLLYGLISVLQLYNRPPYNNYIALVLCVFLLSALLWFTALH